MFFLRCLPEPKARTLKVPRTPCGATTTTDRHRVGEPCSTRPPYSTGREAAFQSGTSTVTRLPSFTEAAFTTVRIARIVRPWRPMTRPMSSWRHTELEVHPRVRLGPRDLDLLRFVYERAGEDEQQILQVSPWPV